jgi:hypothetical protein
MPKGPAGGPRPFAENDEPDYSILADFEAEEWMVEYDERDMHSFKIGEKLRGPRGAVQQVAIRIKEKEWKEQELVREYDDPYPVTAAQVDIQTFGREPETGEVKILISLIQEYFNEIDVEPTEIRMVK